jgi:hypothetical protein
MRKLHRHKENAAAVFFAVCVLRALAGNGFSCYNIKDLAQQAPYFNLMKETEPESEKLSLNMRG